MTMLPLGEAELPEGEFACAHCGVLADTDERTVFTVAARVTPTADGSTRLDDLAAGTSMVLGFCDACRASRKHAADLLTTNPGFGRRLGSPALHLLTGALDALAIIGVTPPKFTAEALSDLIRLAPLGISARWCARFSPLMTLGANTKRCATEPWLFVSVEQRQEIRAAYVDFLARRRPPRPMQCPSDGCMFCGLDSITVKHGKPGWTPASFNASVLRGGRGDVSGHLCPDCQRARDQHGIDGLDAALFDVLDPDGRLHRKRPYLPRFDGLRGWAVTGRKPVRERFGYVAVDRLRATLEQGEW